MATWQARPTLLELLTRIAGDIASRTEGRPFIKRTVERALGFSMGGVAHHLHGHLAWVRDQQFPQSAEAEALSEWADWLEEPRKAGAYAAGQVMFTGAGAVPAGTLVQSDAGALYRVGTPAPGTGVYTVTAAETGDEMNLTVGERLTLVSPIVGVNASAVVFAAITGGADIEDLEAWRERVMLALRARQLYGAPGDYERWALRREGVTDAWEFDRRMGPGTVSLGFMYGGRDDVIPTPSDVAAMQTFIDSVRPADMGAVYVVAPVRYALTFVVSARGTVTASAMGDALKDFFRTDVAIEQPLTLSQVDEVISQVPGELSHTITAIYQSVNGGPLTPIASTGTITPGAWGLFTYAGLSLSVTP